VVGVAEGLAPKERRLPPPRVPLVPHELDYRLQISWAPCEGGVVGVVEGLAPKERRLPPHRVPTAFELDGGLQKFGRSERVEW